jgi:hypothetical protein
VSLAVATAGSDGIGGQPVWEVMTTIAVGCRQLWPEVGEVGGVLRAGNECGGEVIVPSLLSFDGDVGPTPPWWRGLGVACARW